MKWVVLHIFVSSLFLAFLLIPAGRLDWPAAYVCVLPMAAGWVWAGYRLHRDNPILFARRGNELEGTPAWDYRLVALLKASVLAMLVLAGLDAGREARPLQWPFALGGTLLYLVGLRIFVASQQANPFFESMVRHQTEFAHKLVDRGPYARVRHPGYTGFLLVFSAIACVLESTWAAGALLAVWLCFLVRIHWEEAFLREHLEGYADYQKRVRSRLIPGIY
ncbi:isoprenylcysteine carboxylmethyltransferase family protein [bacterium]|nr:isoprenylcysteine carboxylmethyltransferase family protein [bacterium]